ncbi:CGNR zinc finger domain-containing protein [Streptomyces sp. NPDC101149]|uniref:CGNR zinc finger domain-containing protein n=1 Tax=Streptomyces sp. NPDC101149 TaxID=3366113 RepID=UPI003808D26C
MAREPDAPAEHRIAVEVVVTLGALQETMPGWLRPGANPECKLFHIDRSKIDKGPWQSMTICCNRMKARHHCHRTRDAVAA